MTVGQRLLDGLTGAVGQLEFLGDLGDLGELRHHESAIDNRTVTGNNDIAVIKPDKQELKLAGELERKATGAVHRRPGSLDDVPDDPGVRVGNMNDEIGVGVPGPSGCNVTVRLPIWSDWLTPTR